MPVKYGSQPFNEALEYFKAKLRLPSQSWTDIIEGQHTRAFVVAGATQDALLEDLQTAITDALEKGETLASFRKRFDATVEQYGWSYNGGRNWRTRVIYQTNLRTAQMAGRYQQMQQVTKTRPYWQYKHSDSVEHPRPHHLAWNGLVLRHDDPFWNTHYPPNGWGCRCSVRTLSRGDLKRLGKTEPDAAPPLDTQELTIGKNGPNPKTVKVPQGIDPGWGYNVGKSAWGEKLSSQAMGVWQQQKGQAWQSLAQGNWQSAGRPKQLPALKTKTPLISRNMTPQQMIRWISAHQGAAEKVYDLAGLPLLVNAHSLGSHIDSNRSEYLPLLFEAINEPQEVWLNFERHKGTGKIELKARVMRSVQLENDRFILLVAQVRRGMLEGWTFVPVSRRHSYLNEQRKGLLYYAQDEQGRNGSQAPSRPGRPDVEDPQHLEPSNNTEPSV